MGFLACIIIYIDCFLLAINKVELLAGSEVDVAYTAESRRGNHYLTTFLQVISIMQKCFLHRIWKQNRVSILTKGKLPKGIIEKRKIREK